MICNHRLSRRTVSLLGVSVLGLLAGLTVSATVVSAADRYPSRPIRIIVPFTPGGAADYLPRLIGPKLTETWGVPVVVENRPGAGSIIGIDAGAKAAPDGYTFTLVTNAFTVNPSLQPSLPYDTLRDFVPVLRLAATPHVLVVNPTMKASTVADLVASGKGSHNLSFASVGVGTLAQLEGETLKRESGLDLVHVPYKGVAPALTDLISNHVTMMFAAVPDVMPYLQAGTLKPLAVTGPARSMLVPGLPTMIESGYKDFVFEAWFGLIAPRLMPLDQVTQINAEFARILALPEIIEKLRAQGLVSPPAEDFSAFLSMEVRKYKSIIATAGIKAE